MWKTSKFATYHHIKLEDLRDNYKDLLSTWQFEDRLKDYMYGTDTPDHLCFQVKEPTECCDGCEPFLSYGYYAETFRDLNNKLIEAGAEIGEMIYVEVD